MNQDLLSLRKSYIGRLSTALTGITGFLGPINTRRLEMARLVRVMPFWGKHPWVDLGYTIEGKSPGSNSKSVLKLPLQILAGLSYLFLKYLQYLPYRRVNSKNAHDKEFGFFSPTIHLEEFIDRSVTGFWGEVKFLDKRITESCLWVLIPFKESDSSHWKVASKIRRISKRSEFAVFSAASTYKFRLMIKTIILLTKFHFFSLEFRLAKNRESTNCHGSSIFDSTSMGKGAARFILNYTLLQASLESCPKLRHYLHLMEGQSWEFALIELAHSANFGTTGVIHTPIQPLDTQILNYLISDGTYSAALKMHKILCPGVESHNALLELGISRSNLQLIEAQRFIPHEFPKRHDYSSHSKHILYVTDVSLETTYDFIQWTKQIEKDMPNVYHFAIQLHPALNRLKVEESLLWSARDSGTWGVVFFGPHTSAYLQPEFSKSNIRRFNPTRNSSHSRFDSISALPIFSSDDQLEQAIQSPFVLDLEADSVLRRSPNFELWQKELNELFS